jgi:uncharacterized protein YsxB (DUF464 family)
MVKITVTKTKDNKICHLLVEGHALSGEKGSDLVCAGVSTITFGGLNALENPKDFLIDNKEAHIEVTSLKPISNHDEIVLETMLIQYKSIEETNKKYVRVMEKGC